MTGQSIPQDMSTEGVPEVEQEPKHDHVFGVYCHVACPRWGNPEPQPGWEPEQDWLFTFGADHTHPDTGERLGRSFVRIHGTCDSTRTEMLAAFGNRWAFQYISAERAGVEQYGLTEVPMPQSFAVQLDTHLKRLAAERTPSVALVEERTEENTQRCPNCAPGYDCERGIYTPVTPAEERTEKDPWGNADCWCVDPDRPHYRGTGLCIAAGMVPATLRTGVSDVQAEVLEEVEALRQEIGSLVIAARQDETLTRLLGLDRIEKLPAHLDRIEAAVRRGEQK